MALSKILYDQLPDNLEEDAVRRFDKLLNKGELFYEIPRVDLVERDGWQFQFIITGSLTQKPTLSADAPGRTKPIGPFIDPPEAWIVARIGNSHTLILNKYCISRPMLILHTTAFRPQTDDLDEVDLAAAWAVLERCRTEQIIIYNCGVDAGSSQGHKHLQIYPRPDSPCFRLWPDRATSTEEITDDITDIPFRHFVLRLPPKATSADLYPRFQRLLEAVRAAQKQCQTGRDYNVVIVRQWICLIPRSDLGLGSFVANAANMVGSFWIRNEQMRDWMLDQGLRRLLGTLGLPQASLEDPAH